MQGHTQLDARMPARAVQDEDDLLGRAGPHLAREGGEFDLEKRDADRRWQMGQRKDRTAGGGVHETDEGAPVVAMLDGRGGPLPVKAPDRVPDRVQDRFQANAVLVDGPELDARLRERGRHRLEARS